MVDPSALEDKGVDVERPLDGREEGATADMICFLLVVRDLFVSEMDKVSRVAAWNGYLSPREQTCARPKGLVKK